MAIPQNSNLVKFLKACQNRPSPSVHRISFGFDPVNHECGRRRWQPVRDGRPGEKAFWCQLVGRCPLMHAISCTKGPRWCNNSSLRGCFTFLRRVHRRLTSFSHRFKDYLFGFHQHLWIYPTTSKLLTYSEMLQFIRNGLRQLFFWKPNWWCGGWRWYMRRWWWWWNRIWSSISTYLAHGLRKAFVYPTMACWCSSIV